MSTSGAVSARVEIVDSFALLALLLICIEPTIKHLCFPIHQLDAMKRTSSVFRGYHLSSLFYFEQ